MPRRKKTAEEQYVPYLHRFMEWKDGREYAEGTVFTAAQLLEIRPIHICRYMSLLAYGTENPGPNDKPANRRSSGLDFVKKAISKFMPNRNAHWNVEAENGNPTMSTAVNDLIKKIKKAEVRKQGKKSNAKRDLKVSHHSSNSNNDGHHYYSNFSCCCYRGPNFVWRFGFWKRHRLTS
jgi:hypothetical protein